MNNVAFQIYGSKRSGIFQSTWKTDNAGTSASNQIELPLLSGGTYNFWIDWGDGSTTNVTSYSQRTHTYASAGTYTVRITGTITGWGFQNSGDKLKILTITSWGRLKNLIQGFYGCSNLTLSGITDILDLTGTTSLNAMFSGCSKITIVGRMNEWDTSLIISMSNMFVGCVLFNQPLNNWNTGNVTGFVNMFSSCFLFDQCLGNWNVTKCTSFEGMFNTCIIFNNGDNSVPLNNWTLNTTVGANINMTQMFAGNSGAKVFNRALNNWNTSEVTNMNGMFLNSGGTHSFNQPINNWNTAKVTNMLDMFNGNAAFNQDISAWNVSQVTNFTNFMLGKTPATFSSTNLDAIYNGWIVNGVKPNININFGTAKHTAAGTAGRLTLTSAPNNWIITDGGL